MFSVTTIGFVFGKKWNVFGNHYRYCSEKMECFNHYQ